MEKVIAVFVGREFEYWEIAERCEIKRSTVKFHADNAAAKLPGHDPPMMTLKLWWRGASQELMAPPRRGNARR